MIASEPSDIFCFLNIKTILTYQLPGSPFTLQHLALAAVVCHRNHNMHMTAHDYTWLHMTAHDCTWPTEKVYW